MKSPSALLGLLPGVRLGFLLGLLLGLLLGFLNGFPPAFRPGFLLGFLPGFPPGFLPGCLPKFPLGCTLRFMLLALALALLALPAAHAQAPDPPALSAALEQRADKLAHGLRCLVCQNQTLAESNAPLALDMRKLIRGQLAEGKTDAQIMQFFEARYGDFVRYDPPFKPVTWLLWLGPFALLVLGFFVLARTLKRRAVARAPLTEDERARAARYLDTGS